MSTISISPALAPTQRPVQRPVRRPAATPCPQPAASVRLTRRGRVVVLLVAMAVAMVAMVTLGGVAIATRDGGTPPPVRVVEVKPGDTLYGFAGQIARPGHVRDMVQQIEDLNALPGASLQVGQKLALPIR